MKINKLRTLIRESINEYIKEIDEAGTRAMYEAKMKACDKAMEDRKKKIEMAESLEEMQGMFDETKMGELKKEIKMLEKQKAKYGKMLEKMNKGKEVVTEEPTEEAPVEEADITAEMNVTDEAVEETAINESFLKMQKLAGIITETQYRETNEAFDQKATGIAMNFSNTNPNTPSGATAGTTPEKEDPNVKTIIARLKLLTPQLKANDTTFEFIDLIEALIELIQTTNKKSLTDNEVLMSLNKVIIDKRKEMLNKNK